MPGSMKQTFFTNLTINILNCANSLCTIYKKTLPNYTCLTGSLTCPRSFIGQWKIHYGDVITSVMAS